MKEKLGIQVIGYDFNYNFSKTTERNTKMVASGWWIYALTVIYDCSPLCLNTCFSGNAFFSRVREEKRKTYVKKA